jgi:hypothetical protein
MTTKEFGLTGNDKSGALKVMFSDNELYFENGGSNLRDVMNSFSI